MKYEVSKRMEIAAAHHLRLDYESACQRIHGHNYIVVVYCTADKLNHNGMVVDFKAVKNTIHGKLDHRFLDEIFDFNPTAENMAKWICDQVNNILLNDDGDGYCYKVTVQESEGNIATYNEGNPRME